MFIEHLLAVFVEDRRRFAHREQFVKLRRILYRLQIGRFEARVFLGLFLIFARFASFSRVFIRVNGGCRDRDECRRDHAESQKKRQ